MHRISARVIISSTHLEKKRMATDEIMKQNKGAHQGNVEPAKDSGEKNTPQPEIESDEEARLEKKDGSQHKDSEKE